MWQTKRDTADNIIPLLLQPDWNAIRGTYSTPCNTRIDRIRQLNKSFVVKTGSCLFVSFVWSPDMNHPDIRPHEKKKTTNCWQGKNGLFSYAPLVSVKRFCRGVRGRWGWEIPQNPLLRRVEKFPLKITTDNIETPRNCVGMTRALHQTYVHQPRLNWTEFPLSFALKFALEASARELTWSRASLKTTEPQPPKQLPNANTRNAIQQRK